jgi:predicted RNA-binding protein with PUA-like domain
MPKNYWLMKSEPSVFSIDDLKNAENQTTFWDGVRNYQARNLLRDEIKVGDGVFYYHSNTDVIGIYGTAEVVKDGYPDHTAFDPSDPHFDPKSKKENPSWYMVDMKFVRKFERPFTLAELKQTPGLENMKVVQRGMRLSVQPVTEEEWGIIKKMR